MEIHNSTNKQLNDLLGEARREKPVMDIKEVESIISQGKYTPAGGSRGFHIGMNNLIVVCGIVVSSFLAYMALKVDQGDLAGVSTTTVTENSQSPEPAVPISGANQQVQQVTSAETNSPAGDITENPSASLKKSDRIRPAMNPNTLTAGAGTDLSLASGIQGIPAESGTDAETVVNQEIPQLPSGEYYITFNYNGSDIKMMLMGEEVSEFSVDGQLIAAEQYADYDDILAEGKNYLMGKAHKEAGTSSLNLIKYFDGQLRSDGILESESHYQFELTNTQLLVNGETQSEEMFKKYKSLYEARTGKTITAGSVYKFERGAKSQ